MKTRRPKVLLVSQNLGTPGVRSAWREYSVALLESLKALGAEITLVVERSAEYEDAAYSGPSASAAQNAARLSSIYRYLSTGSFEPTLFYQGRLSRMLALKAPAVLAVHARLSQRRDDAGQAPIWNEASELTGIPERLDHLRSADRFLFLKSFYSSASLRAVYGTGPAEIDAQGYDAAITDGLFPVRFRNIPAGSVVTIIHDLSTLEAPSTPAKLRRITGQALLTLADQRGAVAFASPSVQAQFGRFGAAIPVTRSVPLGPLASNRLLKIAAEPPVFERSKLLARADLAAESANLSQMRASKVVRHLLPELFEDGSREERAGSRKWDPTLPYFVLVWPPERQVDLGLAEKLASKAEGRANLIVLRAPGHRSAHLNLYCPDVRSEQERLALLAGASALVYPERTGSGPALLEGVALGVPVICPDLPLHREFAPNAVFYDGPADGPLLSEIVRVLDAPTVKGATASGPLRDPDAFARTYRAEPSARLQELLGANST